MRSKLFFLLILTLLIGHHTFSQIVGSPSTIRVNKNKDLVLKTVLSTGIPENYSYLWSGPNSFSSTEKEPKIVKVKDSLAGGIYSVKITNNATTSMTASATISVIIDPAQVKVGFENKNIPVLEGNELKIGIQADGIIESGKEIKISYSIVNSDATENIDYKILSNNLFIFKDIPSNNQKQSFIIQTFKDSNEENEKFTIKLKIDNLDDNWMLQDTMECVIYLKDFKTPAELSAEQFKTEMQNKINHVLDIVNNDKDTTEIIGTLCVNKFQVETRQYKLPSKNSIKTSLQSRNSSDSINTLKPDLKKNYKSYLNNNGFIDTTNNNSKDSVNKITLEKKRIITIDSIEILFNNGVATEIKAYEKDSREIYHNLWYRGFNKSRPRVGISFRHDMFIDRYQSYYLVGHYNSKSLVKLSDLLSYDSQIGLNYAPEDNLKITLKTGQPCKKIFTSTSLNSYINFNIYSDLLSLLKSERGNGLVLTEVSSRIYFNTKPVKKSILFWGNYIEPSLKYSRFENGYESVPVKTKVEIDTIKKVESKKVTIDRMLVNQRKYLEVGTKINIFKKINRFYSVFEGNVFGNFGWFNLQGKQLNDSLNSNVPLYQNITSNTIEFGVELKSIVFQYRNFGLSIGGCATFQKIWNDKNRIFDNGGLKPFLTGEYELFYFPIAKSKDKIFLRTKYIINDNDEEKNFAQIQFGYKAQFKLPNTKLK